MEHIMTGIEKLYDLSSTDRKIEHYSESIREIDLALSDNYILLQNQENLNKASTILQTQEARRTDSELLFESTKTKGDKIEKNLYGGSISNPRELEDMQKELDMIRAQQQKCEDSLFKTLQSVEKTKYVVDKLETSIAKIKLSKLEEEKILTQKKKTLEDSSLQLREYRSKLSTSMNSQHLSLYDAINKSPISDPVVKIDRGMCQGCRISLPTGLVQSTKTSKTPIQCPSCSRILVSS